jgi:hypothetical protein
VPDLCDLCRVRAGALKEAAAYAVHNFVID